MQNTLSRTVLHGDPSAVQQHLPANTMCAPATPLFEQKSNQRGFGQKPAIGVFCLLPLHTYILHRLAFSMHTQAKFLLCSCIRTQLAHCHVCRPISQKKAESAQQHTTFQPASQPSLSIGDGLPNRASSHSKAKLGFKHQP